MIPPHLAPNYDTGGDVTLTVGGVALRFNRADFTARCLDAAGRLGLVEDPRRTDDARADALARVALGLPLDEDTPIVHWAARLAAELHHGGHRLDHWLRRLIVAGAWTDRLVAEGRLEPVFRPGRGFAYRTPDGEPVKVADEAPNWAAHPLAATRG